MNDVVIPTWGEINGYVALIAICAAFFVYAWFRGKREEERTVNWVRDRDQH